MLDCIHSHSWLSMAHGLQAEHTCKAHCTIKWKTATHCKYKHSAAQGRCEQANHYHKEVGQEGRGWRVGLAVRSLYCSCRRPAVPLPTLDSSQPSLTLTPRDLELSSRLLGHLKSHIYKPTHSQTHR